MIDPSQERLVSNRQPRSETTTPPSSPDSTVVTEHQDDESVETMDTLAVQAGLPMPLRFLFALNGFSLAFPVTALLYVVNTRVEMSIALLPTYGAIAFLPNSLRPLYAYLSHTSYRDRLFSGLLGLCAISHVFTALIPKHGVALCFVVAFLRGVATSWPEFLLGLNLVDAARLNAVDYDQTCAMFQSQAATSRYIGSLIASVGALSIVFQHNALTARSMNILLFAPAAANLLGATVALYYRIGRQQGYSTLSPCCTPNYQSILTQDEETGASDIPDDTRSRTFSLCDESTTSHNVRLVLLLQLTVVILALRQPLEEALSSLGWHAMACTSLLTLIVVFVASVWSGKWKQPQKVGLFLILRHLIPSVGYLMSSYLYDVFSVVPYLLQLLSLVDMALSTGAAWSYGKFWSKFSSDTALPLLVLGMTLLSSVVSLSEVWLVHILPTLKSSPWVQFGVVILIQGVVNWTGTWNFLPDVILATTSVKHSDGRRSLSLPARETQSPEEGGEDRSDPDSHESVQERHNRNMQYGTLISCIDFGDQLGALVLGAMVASLDVSRENNWDHLDDLIQYCALVGACSAVFVLVIR